VSDSELLDMPNQSIKDGQLPGFPGHLMRQAREDKGWSQKDTASELHLTSRVINAIEEDDFDVIPSFVFARGYIRSYARYLGLDGQALVAEFDAVYGVPDHNSKPMSAMRKTDRQSRPGDTWVKLVSGLFVVGLIVVSVIWWQSQNSSLTLSQLTNVTVDTSAGEIVVEVFDDEAQDSLDLASMAANQDAVSGAASPTIESADAASEGAAVVAESGVVEASVQASVEEAVPEPTMAANEAVFIMLFDNDCWVEIKDGNGKMVLSDLYAAGDRIEQVMVAPIEVLLGRSSAVTEISFAGRSIDLKPYTRKDIARVTLTK
jgi:cytoskeleton protein RodZ